MAYIGNSPANIGNYQIVDDISSTFNGVLTSFALTASSLAINPAKSGQLLVSINGVLQEPDDTGAEGFKVSGSNIVFSSAPATGSTFWAVWQGQAVDIGTPSDSTVGTAQLSATGTKSGTTYLAGDNTWKTVVTDLVNDITPQLGGDLDLNGHVITGLSTDPTMGGDLSGTASNAQIVANAVGTTEIANSAVTDAKISGMSSSKLSGALPAIDGSALTNLPAGGGLQSIQVFTSSGTWNKPAGITKIKVTVTGGGGGGYDNGTDRSGSGGAAGGTAIEVIDVSSISSVSVTIGSGGGSGNPGTTGGTSSFGAYCSATGGTGGNDNTNTGYSEGGTATGGDINITGGDGGVNVHSGQVDQEGGDGGSSYWGGGGHGGSHTQNDAEPGKAYGSGGGGRGGNSAYGDSGKAGVVMVEEFE